jgi:hypothetical protein
MESSDSTGHSSSTHPFRVTWSVIGIDKAVSAKKNADDQRQRQVALVIALVAIVALGVWLAASVIPALVRGGSTAGVQALHFASLFLFALALALVFLAFRKPGKRVQAAEPNDGTKLSSAGGDSPPEVSDGKQTVGQSFAAGVRQKKPESFRVKLLLAGITAILAVASTSSANAVQTRYIKPPVDCLAFLVQVDEVVDDDPMRVATQALTNDPRKQKCTHKDTLKSLAAK